MLANSSSANRIKLRHLKCFLAIFRSGSISAAASSLSLSQPAVTKTLKELEEILGTRLIERGRGTAELTIQGEVFMPRAAACIIELEHAVESVTVARAKTKWQVHVGAMPSTETSLLPVAVGIMQREVPDAVVKISTGSMKLMTELVLDNKIDLFVGHMPTLEQMIGLTFQYLYVEPYNFFVRRGHPLADKRPCDIAALKEYEMILPEQSAGDNPHVSRLLTSIGLTDDINDHIISIAPAFMGAFLLESDAICVAPEGAFFHGKTDGRLVELDIDTSHSTSPVGIICKEDVAFQPATDVMIRALQSAVKKRNDPNRWKTFP